jgi:hypothetical protein
MTTAIISQQRRRGGAGVWRRRHGGGEVPRFRAQVFVRDPAAATTCTACPRTSRIIAGAMDSSLEGDRTGSSLSRVCQSTVEKPSHRGPCAAAANRTPRGADLEARLTVEAECRPAQWQVSSPDWFLRAQEPHTVEMLRRARRLLDRRRRGTRAVPGGVSGSSNGGASQGIVRARWTIRRLAQHV